MLLSDIESLASSLADLLRLHLPHEPQTLEKPPLGENDPIADAVPIEHAASTASAQTHRVDVARRRGLLAFLTIVPEYDDARNYPKSTKALVVFVVALAAVTGPMGTSILLPAIDDVVDDLGTSVSIVNVSVGVYLLLLGIFPMWWSNFSEKHGRRSVYVVSFVWFLAFSIGCALAPSISALIVLRLLAGAGASAVQSVGAATVSDLYIQQERGTALGLFYLGPLVGPFISPILGGAVAQAWGWRATMWVMVIFCALNVISVFFLLPETLRIEDSMAQVKERLKEQMDVPPAELERIATNLSQHSSLRRDVLNDETVVDPVMPSLLRLTTNGSSYSKKVLDYEMSRAASVTTHELQSWSHLLYEYLVRPTHAVLLLGYPPVTLTVAYSAITFMGVYFLNITISNEYSSAPYNFSTIIVGLMYIPNSFTYILASVFGGRWNDWLIRRYASRHNGEMVPESRISWNLVLAVVLFPSLLIFGWCLDKGEHWVTPLIGSAIFGFACMLVIGITITYLIDILPGKGATGVALNNLVRQILAATATFITEPLILAIGVGVLFSIYVGITTVAALLLFYLKRNGAALREKYDITEYYAKL